MSIKITFPDGNSKEFEQGITPIAIAKSIGERLAMATIAAKINGIIVDASTPITEDVTLELLTSKNLESLEILRHSSAHLLAHALTRMYPGIKLTIGPVVDDGFYYDIDADRPFKPEDFLAIEQEMAKLAKENIPITRTILTKKEALHKFATNEYKVELIEAMPDYEIISCYTQAEFIDLCRGPHLPSTGHIKAFKLMKVAGAYWRGDAKNKQLQRIYGTAFFDKKELDEYIKKLEEAEKRDHRKLVKDLDLAYFHEFAPGAPFFLPKGTIMYALLVDFIREEYRKRGYQEVITPQMYNKKLWEISGHWEHYKENMFIINVEGQEHSLKPMNCPSHCLIFNRDTKSYKDLPIRIADFCNLHRNEFSGTLTGLVRVRKFAQDDAHIFCRFDQIEEEVLGVLEFIKYVWNEVFGFKLTYYLSTRPEQCLGTKELWDKAESLLANALTKAGISFKIKEGDGAFYGPKIDIDLEDALGRKWQCPTCQLDFNLPHRFETMYIDEHGNKQECVMIHRAILGSLERFFGMMVEHYAGKFPLWLAPVQVIMLPIADRHVDYCTQLAKEWSDMHNLRVEVDDRTETTPKKVRDAQMQQIPLMITIGDKEMEQHTLAVRTLDGKVKFGVKKEDLLITLLEIVKSKSTSIDLS